LKPRGAGGFKPIRPQSPILFGEGPSSGLIRRAHMPSRLLILFAVLLALFATGCTPGALIARQLVKAPNRQPGWVAPPAKVTLNHTTEPVLLLPDQTAFVGQPPVKLHLRIAEPGDYRFATSNSWTTNSGRPVFEFEMHAVIPSNAPVHPPAPRGTIFILHGYALNKVALAPWGFFLAEAGYRCVLVDLRGHGRSASERIYFGTREADDLRELLTELTRRGVVAGPVGVLGDSYGAVIALRWAATDARVRSVVAISPYARLATAMEGIRQSYAAWVPAGWVKSAAQHLPAVLGVPPEALDTVGVLAAHPITALFVAGGHDVVAPLADVRELQHLSGPASELIELPLAIHEVVPFDFDRLGPPVRDWFARGLR
jgi:pimeloyl-ACP methyl ester carboxylesterase